MQVVMQPQQPISSGSASKTSQQGTKPGNIFLSLLGAAKTTPTEETEQTGNTLGDLLASLFAKSEDLTQFWNPAASTDEKVKELLDGLPPDVKKKIEKILSEAADHPILIPMHPTPEMKLAFLLQVVSNDQHQLITDSMKKEIGSLIEKWFPGLSQNVKSDDPLKKQITQLFQQIKDQVNNEKTVDRAAFTVVMDKLSTDKKIQNFAERAFQRFVPTKVNEPARNELQTLQSPLSPVEQWTLKVPVSQGENQVQEFVKEVQQIISRGKLIVQDSGFAKMQIRLSPDHLGSIEIQLTQRHGEITAKIVASNQSAKDALDSHLTQLKQAFQGQKIDVDKLEVFLQRDDQPFRSFDDSGRQNQQNDSQNGQRKRDDSEGSNVTFEDQLLSELVLNEKV